MFSIPHMVVVFVIVLVVFGPQKLPELARSLGKLLAEFRKAPSDFRSAFEEEMKDLERQAREVERKKAAEVAAKAADAAPVQAATFATPAGTETPAANSTMVMAENGDVGFSGSAPTAAASEIFAGVSADAFGEAIDARVTEGSGELVVTPVAEAVARGSMADNAEVEPSTSGPGLNGDRAAGDAGTDVSAPIPTEASAQIVGEDMSAGGGSVKKIIAEKSSVSESAVTPPVVAAPGLANSIDVPS